MGSPFPLTYHNRELQANVYLVGHLPLSPRHPSSVRLCIPEDGVQRRFLDQYFAVLFGLDPRCYSYVEALAQHLQ